MSPEISIIIPVYNQEKYLGQCLDSILAQTFFNFEVILIDDGSTDDTASICEEYVQRDSRFRLIRKTNGGVSSARNVGIEHALGKYVTFVDSDDRVPNNSLENHINQFADNVDMTLGSFMACSENGQEEYRVGIRENGLVPVNRCLFDFTPNGQEDWQRYLWNRMMRLSIIKEYNLRFNEKIAYKEDGLFLVQYLLKCKGKVAYFSDIVYCYCQNSSSAMGSLNSGHTEKLATNIDAHALIIKEMRTAEVPDDILGREIRHAFQSRRWVLGKLYVSNYYYKAWLRTLATLLHAVGFTTSAKIVVESICGKAKSTLLKK